MDNPIFAAVVNPRAQIASSERDGGRLVATENPCSFREHRDA